MYMKISLNITQFLLALYTITGAVYMMDNYEDLASTQALTTLPSHFWIGLGAIQIIFALGLMAALFFKRAKKRAFGSAVCLAGLALLGSILYSAYAGFPGILWAIIPALLYAFIAYQHKYFL